MNLLLPEGLLPQLRENLLEAYQSGRFPHAVLLEGPPEETLALGKRLAAASVCTASDARPCGACPACKKALADGHPDIIFLSGTGGSRSFHKDSIAFLRSDASVRPNEAEVKVYLLHGADTMSREAQNALLKILEEPEGPVQFLLTAESAAALLPTIRSRVQTFSLTAALSPQDPQAEALAAACCTGSELQMLSLSAPLLKDRSKLLAVLPQLAVLFRDALVLREKGQTLYGSEASVMLSQRLTRPRLFALLEAAQAAMGAAQYNANTALLATQLCASLRRAAGK